MLADPRATAAPAGVARPGWPALLLLLAGVALLIGAGEALLALFPVPVRLTSDGATLTATVGSQSMQVALERPAVTLRFPAVDPHHREYQIDGSDSTNNFSEDPAYIDSIATSPYYRFSAWLRDEAGYSRWQDLVVRDAGGSVVARADRPAGDHAVPLPAAFTLTVDLHRMETPRSLELVDGQGTVTRLVINRNDKFVALSRQQPGAAEQELARRYFPVDPAPALAENLYMLLRALALAPALALLLLPLAAVLPARPLPAPRRRALLLGTGLAALVGLGLMLFDAVRLFDREPHILDGFSYYFQGKVLAGGALTVPAPPVPSAFPTPFTIIHAARWFSQYPPGTPLALALGFRVGLPWLVEPLLALAALLLTGGLARRQYGNGTALLAVVLMASSPFLQLQAGTFMSHAPALFGATLALYAVTRYVEAGDRRWLLLAAAALGYAFWCREIAAVLYGLALAGLLLWRGRERPGRLLGDLAPALVVGAVFLAAYLGYNAALTGSALLLPRNLFNPADKFGFGVGVGFYGRHTLASGLVNTDELLTSLTITLFGWPFSLALAFLALPFLRRRPADWDVLHGAIVALFVLAYVGYFYHGITYGPRYYLEAVPSMAVLAARGLQRLAAGVGALLAGLGRGGAAARARPAAGLLLVALLACDAVYFEPRQAQLYAHLSGRPGTGGLVLGDFIRRAIPGREVDLPNAVVATSDPGIYGDVFGPMNCPDLRCATIFLVLPEGADGEALRAYFAKRTWYSASVRQDTLTLDAAPSPPPVAGVAPEVAWSVPPAALALQVGFEGSAAGSGGQQPVRGEYAPAPGRHGQGALLVGTDRLVYRGIALDPRQGTVGLWVQPTWDGTDGQSHAFVQLGADGADFLLSKDGANNLRFQIFDGAVESDLAFPAASWRRGEWHHVGGEWSAGSMRLLVDGRPVAERAARLPGALDGSVHLGATADGTLECDCVADDLIVARAPVGGG